MVPVEGRCFVSNEAAKLIAEGVLKPDNGVVRWVANGRIYEHIAVTTSKSIEEVAKKGLAKAIEVGKEHPAVLIVGGIVIVVAVGGGIAGYKIYKKKTTPIHDSALEKICKHNSFLATYFGEAVDGKLTLDTLDGALNALNGMKDSLSYPEYKVKLKDVEYESIVYAFNKINKGFQLDTKTKYIPLSSKNRTPGGAINECIRILEFQKKVLAA